MSLLSINLSNHSIFNFILWCRRNIQYMLTFKSVNVCVFQTNSKLNNKIYTQLYLLSQQTMETLYTYNYIVKYNDVADIHTGNVIRVFIADMNNANYIPIELSLELNRYLYKSPCLIQDVEQLFYGIRHKYYEYESYNDPMLLIKTDQKEYLQLMFQLSTQTKHWYLNTNGIVVSGIDTMSDINEMYFFDTDNADFIDNLENSTRYVNGHKFTTFMRKQINQAYQNYNFIFIPIDKIINFDDCCDQFEHLEKYTKYKYLVILGLNKKECRLLTEIATFLNSK